MPAARRLSRHALALVAYGLVAVVFTWPLSRHLSTALLGSTGGDLGAYIWNLWVFRHQISSHHQSPLFTSEILSLTPPAALTLHNYTAFADFVSYPFLDILGIVTTFNLVSLGALVLSAYAMFVYALVRTRDAWAAWLAGLAFGFSSFLVARQTEHLSLALAAPLPVFGLLLYRMAYAPSRGLAVAAGLVVAWAFLCDPYYAVYCLFILVFSLIYMTVSVEWRSASSAHGWGLRLLDVTITRPAISLKGVPQHFWVWTALATMACVLALSPVLVAMASPLGSPLNSAPVLWRSSAPGLDLLAYVLPGPFSVWRPDALRAWWTSQPNGVVENIATLSLTAVTTIVGTALVLRRRPHVGWVVFTLTFFLLSLGPFIRIAGFLTFVPTPWALIRYLPILGAARMPSRLAVLVVMGISMLLAMAVSQMRNGKRAQMLKGIVTAGLLLELWPGPRTLYSAQMPAVFRHIVDDGRDVRVLSLPFGLRDGLSSRGNYSARSQFFQTFHEKPLIGGYLSRLPPGEVDRYERLPVVKVLLDLSEGRAVDSGSIDEGVAAAEERRRRLNVGWVAVDRTQASAELIQFAARAFALRLVEQDEQWAVYRADPQ